MAASSDVLLRLLGRSGGGGGSQNYPSTGTPSYEMLNRLSQQHQNTPKKSSTTIPSRYQYGGVATDENDNATWQPQRDEGEKGTQASGPDYYFQQGGMVAMTPAQQQAAYQQSISAMMPYLRTVQMARPMYTAQMLANPPSKLSGYAGELGGGYQEGGTVDRETGRVQRNYATEHAGDYNYVDPRAAAYGPQGFNPAGSTAPYDAALQEILTREMRNAPTGEEFRKSGVEPADSVPHFWGGGIMHNNPDYFAEQYGFDFPPSPVFYGLWGNPHWDASQGPLDTRPPIWNPNQFPPDIPPVGPDYNLDPGTTRGTPPKTEKAEGGVIQQMQDGGIASMLPMMMGGQQQQQQREQPQKEQPQKAQAKRPGPYEFGPSNYFYNAPEWKRAQEMQRQQPERATGGMKKGGVIKELLQHLAKGGIVKNPADHLLVGLGLGYGLSARDAEKTLDKKSRSNPMPP